MSHAVNLLLPVLDTLSYAANAATEDENYKKGVLMTMDKANAAFTAMGVEEIEAAGKPFDPETATAVCSAKRPRAWRAARCWKFSRRDTGSVTKWCVTPPSSSPNK